MKRFYLISLLIVLVLTGFVFGQSVAIDGPNSAGIGELCVFHLTSEEAIADWQIIPQAEFYVDTSKRTLVFSTPKAGNYTIIAATVVDGNPLALTHSCRYGGDNVPNPEPEPKPDPEPEPPKPLILKDWVTQNIPSDGKKDTKYLAECFDSAASGMERGMIRSVDAAYASVRSCTQTKVNNKIWATFFDGLAAQVHEKLSNGTTKDLAVLYRQIAQGLRAEVTTPENCPTGNCPAR